ncbi:unnamed protein product [Heligmosomoides polygyrus]|uniref:G_PROTEIN_RECEP_F1_2 domain-containing protein n=1 Tax=Heligmosomoides polygyrus TaxID=6339 RepID=A0A183GLE3_HELPZ|nr:unnamed protein product [Heligmosomoides polygyrus]
MEIHWVTNDIVSLVADVLQVILFIGLYAFARFLTNDRLDAHHKAQARGDVSILFGCCAVLFVKLILQSVEVEYQRKDGFVTMSDAVIATVCYVAVQASQWLQYLSVRRILAMSDRDCRATKRFLPLVAAGGLLMAWIHFGITFFDTSLIKYQLTDETFNFSQTTLICMIFTQTIFPADYLFAFTVSGCYLEILQRFFLHPC